jgi:hypothetical protein
MLLNVCTYVCMYERMYTQYIQGLCQSRLSTANHALLYNIIYKYAVRTSQETHDVSATKPNLLMLFREIIAVYCENRMEHISRLWQHEAELF